jgi:hypothetical protein
VTRPGYTFTTETTFGLATILIDNRVTGGTPFFVADGNTNFNVNADTTTFQCVAAVPVLPWLAGLALAVGSLGVWTINQRRQARRT